MDFFQLLRDRILNRAFIILQRHPTAPTEENQEDKSESDEFVNNSVNEGTQQVHLEIDVSTEVSSSADANETKERSTTDALSHLVKRSCVEKNAKSANSDCTSPSDSKKFKVDIESFYSNLKSSNSLEIRCESVLNLALCLSQDSPDVEISDCLAVLKYLSDSSNFPHLAVCHSLLLCAFTRMPMSLAELGLLEERILSLAESLKKKDLVERPDMYKVEVLSELHCEVVHTLCQELFGENYIDFNKVDISTICCSSLNNLSCIIKQHDSESGAAYTFRNSTIKYVLGMTGKSTQEIVSENIQSSFQMRSLSVSSFRIKLCLQILEQALAVNPDLSYCESLHHESFSLPHCLTRLLGWSATYVFPSRCNSEDADQDSDCYSKFYHSTLICILKILSVLTFNPNMYDTFTNVKGLMEKILICVLKAYFESENNHFDIQVLCLEMLINLYIKNQKTFVLLCLKKFKINESEEVLAVEALIKMLSDNLEKIKEVKEASYSSVENNTENTPKEDSVEENLKNELSKADATDKIPSNEGDKTPGTETTSNSEEVLQAASKDMEHSTIVSFICVLIVFFMRTKQNFKEFILERLTLDALKEATTVSRKFLEFASLTGGMPVTGILILSQTITKLQAMQS